MNDHAFGVQQSLTGRQWVWRTGLEERIGQGIAQALGVPELIGRLLAARGVSAAEAANFLDPTLRAMLPDPSSLIDMDAAAARLADAVVAGECVGVFGDYDVDGACSSALDGDGAAGARLQVALPCAGPDAGRLWAEQHRAPQHGRARCQAAGLRGLRHRGA